MVLICPSESVVVVVMVVVEVVVKPEDCGNSTGGEPNLATTSARVVLSFSIHLTSSGMIRLPSSAVAHPYRTKARTISIGQRMTSLFTSDERWGSITLSQRFTSRYIA